MPDKICPVHQTLSDLKAILEPGHLSHPKSRRIAEEIVDLLTDVAWGRAGDGHLSAIKALVDELALDADSPESVSAAEFVRDAVDTHREVFQSHIDTHNCSSGDCVRLVPAPCQMACPAGIDVPTYVSLIAEGLDDEAVSVIRRDNPFPWVCGLVCTRPCEIMCVRGRIDKPVAIKSLKAFASERALSDHRYVNPAKASDTGKHVAVIGAGPGGLTAAYYLALKGYGVTVFEAHPSAGGMMLLGIPRYRLPREVIDREVAMLEDLGVAFRFGVRFGKDLSPGDLKSQGFDAVFLGIGAHRSFKLHVPGEEDFPQVLDAIGFLRRVALGDRRLPGKRAVVVGGGNVAIDAARTCLRLGSREVAIAYRRTRTEMPADVEEVEQAEAEGIRLSFLTVPKAVLGHSGRVTGLLCLKADLVEKGEDGRFFPVPIPDSDFTLEADVVIPAIGQQVDLDCLQGFEGLQWTRRQTIQANTVSMETAVPGVFAGGDVVSGPATVVEAIGAGKRAAEAIDRYISGIPQPLMPPVPVRRSRVAWQEVPASAKMTTKRPEMPLLNLERRRTTFQQVELGYTETPAREEARRCLRCDICLRCGKCVEVCRDRIGVDALAFGFLDFDRPGHTDFRVTAERCILCGACAANCPNGALKIVDRGDERVLSYCGTLLNRARLEFCESCGAVLGPLRFLEYMKKRIQEIKPAVKNRKLCEACARKESARSHADHLPV